MFNDHASSFDPETFHVNINQDVMGLMQDAVNAGVIFAQAQKQYVVIRYDDSQPNGGLIINSVDPAFFESEDIQCPRQADATYEEQKNHPRGLPSVLVSPQGKITVSKPSLCNGCIHQLRRNLTGDCYGHAFKPLTET